jgi:osmotically-inducible protein OsmY
MYSSEYENRGAAATTVTTSPAQPARPREASAETAAEATAPSPSSPAEAEISESIRKRLHSSKELSLGAKNTVVTTVGTKVTLRGSVKNDEEKAVVEALARATEKVTDVDSRLEVKE